MDLDPYPYWEKNLDADPDPYHGSETLKIVMVRYCTVPVVVIIYRYLGNQFRHKTNVNKPLTFRSLGTVPYLKYPHFNQRRQSEKSDTVPTVPMDPYQRALNPQHCCGRLVFQV